MNNINIFKVLEPISTISHGRFQYYFVEPFGYRFDDGVNPKELKYEKVELDIDKLRVEIKEFTSPFTGKLRKHYFFNYNNEDIYIEDYDSTSETFVEKIVSKLKELNEVQIN